MAPAQPVRPADSSKRLDGIDFLRGLGILFVLLLHVNIRLLAAKVPYTSGIPKQLVQLAFWSGQDGVQMFFVVSGFLITSISLRRWGELSRIRVRDFYWLRFARIAPLLLLLLAVLSGLHFAHVPNFVVSAKQGGLGRALFAALTFHLNFLEAQRGYLPGSWDVLWSLSVEETFYLFFPLACWILGRSKAFIAILLALVAMGPIGRTVLSQGNPIWNEKSYFGCMDAIALGCLTALVASRIRFSRRTLWAIGGGGIFILVYCMGLSVYTYRWGLDRYGSYMSVLALGTCLFIIATAQTQWISPRALTPLLKMGQYSYEVYLTHMFIIFPLVGLFLKLGKEMELVPVLFLAVIVISGFLGAAVAHFYSEPINRALRNRFLHQARPAAPLIPPEAVVPAENQIAL